jgi:hypothetical protein
MLATCYIAAHIYRPSNIAQHMKTTIDIPDPLLGDARQLAAREGTTLRALIEQGLRRVLAEKKKRVGTFQLRDASFGGKGLRPELRDAGWDRLRDLAYEGRGGLDEGRGG